MNSSGEPLDTESLKDSLERSSKKIEEGKKRAEEEKKRLEEKEELLTLLGKANNEIQGIKNSMVTRKEMAKFFDKFDNFLNEFSHIEGYIQDTNAKNKLHDATKELCDTITGIINWIKNEK